MRRARHLGVPALDHLPLPAVRGDVRPLAGAAAGGDGGFTFSWEHGNRWYGSYHFSVRTNKTEVKTTYDNVVTRKTFGQETKGDRFTKDVKSYTDLNDKILKGQFNSIKAVIAKNEKAANKEFEKDRDAQADYYGSKAQTGRIGYGLSSQPRR